MGWDRVRVVGGGVGSDVRVDVTGGGVVEVVSGGGCGASVRVGKGFWSWVGDGGVGSGEFPDPLPLSRPLPFPLSRPLPLSATDDVGADVSEVGSVAAPAPTAGAKISRPVSSGAATVRGGTIVVTDRFDPGVECLRIIFLPPWLTHRPHPEDQVSCCANRYVPHGRVEHYPSVCRVAG